MSRRISLAVASGAGALVLLTACGGSEPPAAAPTPAAATSATFNDADVMFAQMMIPHHRQAVEMADLAVGRAADQEIKDLAAKIKAAQDPEIQTMQGWLQEWGKPLPTGGMDHAMPGIMSEDDMKKLAAAKGAAFDRMFAELMIAHHNGAIEMARTEQQQGADPEAKELAKAIETAQQTEVAQMRALLERL
ncbi:DUF305 domain-containing protein [Nonomuraea endophytica]|uniref:Uncharacterized protein (DUF305 family) n=1 Tax=Nonomuraea endophytica TaxID=714136 RepID=A0A7W8EMZ9_9ACTN|nr:DUF305 domain-containing protein [Nonomuraea endophytica]MBB5084537.1 uncharacterized protein (DUF305 family) [Nonomuraea endophytica]